MNKLYDEIIASPDLPNHLIFSPIDAANESVRIGGFANSNFDTVYVFLAGQGSKRHVRMMLESGKNFKTVPQLGYHGVKILRLNGNDIAKELSFLHQHKGNKYIFHEYDNDPDVFLLHEPKKFDNFEKNLNLDFFDQIRDGHVIRHGYVVVKVNIMFKFYNVVPDFSLEVLDDAGEIKYSQLIGVSAYPNIFNKIQNDVLMEVDDSRNVKIRLTKLNPEPKTIEFEKGSFIIVEKMSFR